MSNQKKTPFAVFNILKSVIESKAKPLNEQVAAGRRAKDERPILQEHIRALRQVISNCRTFDPTERREAEEDLEDQELQLHGIQNRIVRGTQAEQELQHVHKFNELYRSAYKMHINAPRIRELSDLASEIEFRMCSLEEKIWSCEINVDPTCRAPEFVSQAQHDAEKYFSQYRELEQRLFEIKNKLKELQK